MVNVHAAGGERTMTAAKEIRCRTVTMRTTADRGNRADQHGAIRSAETGIDVTPAEHALRLAKLTQNCGLDGVVCSALAKRN